MPANTTTNTDLSGVNDTNVLTSPDGKVSVTLITQALGSVPGGVCNDSPGYGAGTIVGYASSAMPQFPKAALVSYIDDANSHLQYGLGVMSSTTASGFSKGVNDCGVGLGFLGWEDNSIKSASLSGLGWTLGVKLGAQLVSLNDTSNSVSFSNVAPGTTQAQIQSALDSSDASAAKSIMQSLYIK